MSNKKHLPIADILTSEWDGDGKGLRESMKRISDTARGIIDGVANGATVESEAA